MAFRRAVQKLRRIGHDVRLAFINDNTRATRKKASSTPTKAAEYRREQEGVRERLRLLQNANADYTTTGLTILELAGRLHEIFPRREPLVRLETLNLLLKNATLDPEGIKATLRSPFDALQTTIASLSPENGHDDDQAGSPGDNARGGRKGRRTSPKNNNGTLRSAPQNHVTDDQERPFSASGKWRGRRGSNPRPQA